MKISNVAKGLVGILLAGSLSLNSIAQKREYIKGNVNNVKYELTTEKDFPKYKIEEQCLFDNCYTFWNYTPKKGELNFWVSNKGEESITFQEGKQVEINAPQYIPTKMGEKINVTNLPFERTSYEKLKKRAKETQYFGFSIDINDKDLKFNLPEINVNGNSYIVLKEMIDNSNKQTDIPFYLIPKTKGTKIVFLNQSFIEENGYLVQAQILCDEKGGVYQPILEKESKGTSSKSTDAPLGIPVKQDTTNAVGNQSKKSGLEDLSKTSKAVNKNEREPCHYTVKKGDTGFWSIAGKVLNDEKRYIEIKNLNPNLKSKKLEVGQEIVIPCK
jgi:hypothetical protein